MGCVYALHEKDPGSIQGKNSLMSKAVVTPKHRVRNSHRAQSSVAQIAQNLSFVTKRKTETDMLGGNNRSIRQCGENISKWENILGQEM